MDGCLPGLLWLIASSVFPSYFCYFHLFGAPRCGNWIRLSWGFRQIIIIFARARDADGDLQFLPRRDSS